MSNIITITVYTLDELSCPVREKPATGTVSIMLTATGMKTCMRTSGAVCDIFGIDLRQRVFRLSNGRFMEEPCIWFSGCCSRRDGACFEGRWHWQPATARIIRKYAPQEHELHRIADALQAVQKRNFWQLQAEIHRRGRYCHPYSMDITVTRNSPTGQTMTTDAGSRCQRSPARPGLMAVPSTGKRAQQADLRCPVDEALLINEYTFTEAGLRTG